MGRLFPGEKNRPRGLRLIDDDDDYYHWGSSVKNETPWGNSFHVFIEWDDSET